jgi:hypothetical protein
LIKNNHQYVIVPDVVDEMVVTSNIRLKGKREKITFSTTEGLYLRSMKEVSAPERYVPNILAAVKLVFPLCTERKLMLLTSEAGDVAQTTHTDYVTPEAKFRIANLQEFHYSAVISIEQNTRLLVGESRKSIDIPLRAMLFFRGDMLHAGAGYPVANSRLFLSISSHPFPATKDVYCISKNKVFFYDILHLHHEHVITIGSFLIGGKYEDPSASSDLYGSHNTPSLNSENPP